MNFGTEPWESYVESLKYWYQETPIQYFDSFINQWIDYSGWTVPEYNGSLWRVKPKAEITFINVVFLDEHGTPWIEAVTSQPRLSYLESSYEVKKLGDWQTVEV